MNEALDKRTDQIRMPVNGLEKRLIETAARSDGETMTAWARRQLVRLARRKLGREGGR